jgi:hypothetical protein
MANMTAGILISFGKQYSKTIWLIALLLWSADLHAQPYFLEDMVNVKGQLVNENTGEVVPYAQIINPRIHGGTISDQNGFFSLQADPTDTLLVKTIGFVNYLINVSDYLKANDDKAVFKLSPIRYLIQEVEVEGDMPKVNMQGIPRGEKSDIPIELRSDNFSSPPHWSNAVLKPLSFLHYKLSKKEKRKRKAISAIQTQREWEYFSLVYNKDIIERLTGLKNQELDDFMVYCNANHGLHYSASSYEVEEKIKQLFKVYKKYYLDNTE